MSSNVRLLPIGSETLRQLLCLPATTKIIAVRTDEADLDVVVVRIEDPQFGEIEQGTRIPEVSAEFDIVNGRPEFNRYIDRSQAEASE